MAHSAYLNNDGVPVNKYGIDDNNVLDTLEYAIAEKRQKEILSGEKQLKNNNFDIEHLKEIHHHLFGDVYGWAGKTRTVPSSKRGENNLVGVFAPHNEINDRWALLETKTKGFVENKNNNYEEKVNGLVDIFVEANNIHVFPDGNGRTLQTLMQQLAQTQNMALDFSKTNAKNWNEACQVSGTHGQLFEDNTLAPFRENKEPIRRIFHDIISHKIENKLSKPISERPKAEYKPQVASKGFKR